MRITKDLYEACKSDLGKSREFLAEKYGISERLAYALKVVHDNIDIFRIYGDKIDTSEPLNNISISHESGGISASAISRDKPLTKEEMFALCGIDKKEYRLWKVKKHKFSHHEVPMKLYSTEKGENGKHTRVDDRPTYIRCFANSMVLEPLKKEEYLQAYIEDVLSKIEVKPFEIKKRKIDKSGLLFVLNLADVHFGQWCWESECGRPGNMAETERRVLAAVKKSIASAMVHGWEKCVLNISGDLLTIDDTRHTTTKGTTQDIDGTFEQIYERGLDLLISSILTIAEYSPVRVVMLPGNHDKGASRTLACALQRIFKYKKGGHDIEISPCIQSIAYERWGSVLLGMAHCNGIKVRDLPLIMDMDNKTDDVFYREFLIGHEHQKLITQLEGNTLIRRLVNLSLVDSWGHGKGYRSINTGCQSFLYSKTCIENQYFIKI